MDFKKLIDSKEIKNIDEELLNILLVDRTINKNIIWATDSYENYGRGFWPKDNILGTNITGKYKNIIKPRILKDKKEQVKRARFKAEVFTPAWICNKQNNLVDENWFGYKNVFNMEKDLTWQTTKNKIVFPKGKTWQDYVLLLRLEVACGEAPYLVSRYDVVSGKAIEVTKRIGLLDRKFRVINENCAAYDEWLKWAVQALKSVYGFDWQGDNVLIARENLLYTFIDNYRYQFKKKPSWTLVKQVATIISWNIWQMDGINYKIPYSTIDAKIMNWQTNRPNKFVNIINKK